MKLKLLALALLLLAIPVAGCSSIFSNLPQVLAYVQDGQLVLSTIESFAASYFAVRPDADLQAKVNKAIAKAKTALDLAIRAAQGVDGLKQADVDAAFQAFRQAYQDLLSLLGPMGVSEGEGLRLSSSDLGQLLVVPKPLALMGR